MNRRRFLVRSLESAAGLGIIAGCDRRIVDGTDIRKPSAPMGLAYDLFTSDSGTVTVTLAWDRHNLTDITGAPSETAIQGYNVYRDGTKLTPVPCQNLSYVDSDPPDGFIQGQAYTYTITAVDASGNESPYSDPQSVYVQKQVFVYFASSSTVDTGTFARPNFQTSVIKGMIDGAVARMQIDKGVVPAGSAATAAWESLFPGLGAASLIGIKINTLGGGNVSTRPEVVNAIVASLVSMLGNTFPAYNIIVFDDRSPSMQMRPAGYNLRDQQGAYRIASSSFNTTLNGVPVNQEEAAAALWASAVNIAGEQRKITAICNAVDYLINVPVLKDHAQAGISFSMKNMYGITDIWNGPGSMHNSMCSPSIPALYAAKIQDPKTGVVSNLQDKIRLIAGDALHACYEGGPSGPPNAQPNTIVVGTDPVAMDTWAMKKINELRAQLAPSLPRISWSPSTNPSQSDARHIWDAATKYSLGSTNCVAREVTVS